MFFEVVVVVLKFTRTDAGSFLLVHGINTVFLITTYFLLLCSFREVIFLLVLKGILTPINNFSFIVLGLILSLFDILEFLSSFDNDIFLIVQPKLVNSRALIGANSCFVPGTGVKSFGRERIDLLVKVLLIFLFTSIPLQRLQRFSPSPHS